MDKITNIFLFKPLINPFISEFLTNSINNKLYPCPKKTELSTNNLVKKKKNKLLKLKNRYVIKAADLAPFLRHLTLSTQISWLRIVPGKYFKNFFTFLFILFHSIAFLLVFFKIINENTSKFPLTTIFSSWILATLFRSISISSLLVVELQNNI